MLEDKLIEQEEKEFNEKEKWHTKCYDKDVSELDEETDFEKRRDLKESAD